MDDSILKIFHNAVFDVSFLMKNLNLKSFENLVCTKIASKIINGLDHNNSLKPLLKEYLNVEISKELQLSDWTRQTLSHEQMEYAMNDVKFLYDLWKLLENRLYEYKLNNIAYETFRYIPIYVKLVERGIENIFSY